MPKIKKRCWGDSETSNGLMTRYHDEEWGVPLHDDRGLFEFLILDGAQAGLSWNTILQKRENYRKAFDQFDPAKIARYSEKRIEKLLANPGIIRNRQKVNSAVKNAKAFLKVCEEFGTLDAYIWRFSEGKTMQNRWKTLQEIPVSAPLSDTMSKDLKSRGFSFVGTTICYAYIQTIGMVNDHLTHCFRHKELRANHKK